MARLTQLASIAVVVLCAAVIAAADSEEKPVRAEFLTCGGCKLARMPELRGFIKDVGRLKPYGDAVTVNYVQGASPVLILYSASGEEISRTPLDNWTTQQLHTTLESHGFRLTADYALRTEELATCCEQSTVMNSSFCMVSAEEFTIVCTAPYDAYSSAVGRGCVAAGAGLHAAATLVSEECPCGTLMLSSAANDVQRQ